MKTVALSAIGILIAAVVIYGVILIADTRARIVSTHILATQLYQNSCAATPANQSPNAPSKE